MYITLVFKTFTLYFFIILVYRLMGKKEVEELNIIDLIVTILIAELAAICIEESEKSIFTSILPILSLVFIEISLSYFSMKSEKSRNFIDGKPSIIIKDGKVNFSVMTKLRYSLDDLLSQLRSKEVKSIEEVDYDVLREIGKKKEWIYNLMKNNNVQQ